MMNSPFKHRPVLFFLTVSGFLFLAVSGILFLANCSGTTENALDTNSDANIFPEYYHLTIPPNIAPLNFVVKAPGTWFRIEISSVYGKGIVIRQRSANIKIPISDWKRILSGNRGKPLKVDIWSFHQKRWYKYNTIEHHISADPIDPYLAYRLVYATYLKWNEMGIYQRNLTNFDETPIIENASTGHGCMNCHSFSGNDPSKMLIHFRILHPGTLLWNKGELIKIDTRTPSTLSAGIYPAWHPHGTHIAFSTGKISPHMTSRLDKVVDVSDRESDLIVYDIEQNRVTTSPAVSTKRRENMPVWSADGRYLYYISAPEAVKGDDEGLRHSRYSLMRIAYNTIRNTWGESEIVLHSDTTGMSISMPSISPDGKYVVCSMSDDGYFTIFHKDSDLYCLDLEAGCYKKLELNSENSESYSAWSSNSRWLVFSSKRMDNVFSRTYIAYMDENGTAHTPFVLPQEDPEIYYRLLANYNLPKLITGQIDIRPVEIRDMVNRDPRKVKYDH